MRIDVFYLNLGYQCRISMYWLRFIQQYIIVVAILSGCGGELTDVHLKEFFMSYFVISHNYECYFYYLSF